MKKVLKGLLALALLLSLSATALANPNPTGSNEVTIDNSGAGSSPTEDVEIDVQGRLGHQDNTIPGDYPPATDPFWINIALPTFVFFHTTPDATTGIHGLDLDSPTYFIRNYSYHAIEISVDDFDGKTAADNTVATTYIDDLELVFVPAPALTNGNGGTGTDITLMVGQAFATFNNDLFVTIEGNDGDWDPAVLPGDRIPTDWIVEGPSVVSFEFDGELDALPANPNTNPMFDLVFTFQSVHRDPSQR